ncbi:MAG: efflux RND transporter permease subunit [Bacteroidota bacterium]
MRNLITYLIKYPIWTNVVIVIILVAGAISVVNINKRYFPETDPNTISIQVPYPGSSPEEIEEGVVTKIEDAIEGIQGIEEVNSTSRENLGSVTVNVQQDYDAELVLTEVKNAVDQINSFPVSAEKPVIYNAKPRGDAIDMVVVGNTELMALKKYAEGIRDDLLTSDVISQVTITGFPDLEFNIEVSEETLRRYGLTFDQVSNAISANNRDVSSGSVKSEREEILLRARSKENDASGISNVIIRTNPDGSVLRLRDIATTEMRFADVPNKTTYNGKPSVTIKVQTLPEEDILLAVDYVKAYTQSFNESNDLIEIILENDRSDYLLQRLNTLLENGTMGLILVLVLLGLFLSTRLSFWVAFGIPFSFMGMLFIADTIDVSINIISLFGGILVIGILVDDGIIVGENIYAHFEKGKSPLRASIDGTMEVIGSVFTGVSTTIIAFCIFFFIEGRFGQIMLEMAIVVILCLIFSLLECFFILPPHLAHSGALTVKEKGRFRTSMENGLRYVKDRLYGPLITIMLRYRYWVVATAIALLMLTIGLMQGSYVGFGFFPFIDRDDMTAELVLQPGTREQITESYLLQIEKAVWEINEEIKAERPDGEDVVLSTIMSIGSSGSSRGGVSSSGSHTGTVKIQLLGGEVRNMPTFAIGKRIQDRVGQIPEAEQFAVGARGFFGRPFSMSMKSKDLNELDLAEEYAKKELTRFPALTDITNSNIPGNREIDIQLKPLAYVLGLTQSEITRQIRQGFFGQEAQRLQIGTDEVRVWLRYPPENRKSLTELEQIKIKLSDNREYALGELVDYKITRGVASIKHLDGAREIRIEADLVDKDQSIEPIVNNIRSELVPELAARYPGVQVSFEGQNRRSEEIGGSLAWLGPLILGLIFMVITLTFRSFSQASLIMLMIPLGFVGAVMGHYFHGAKMSIFSVYGIIALMGVIVNDAVVFVDKFNRLLKEGHSVASAISFAGKSRFRPIILTSLTTVLGLYPLILAKSRQAQFLVPMAISVAYGVLLGTFFILTIFPALIAVMNDLRVFVRTVWHWAWNAEWKIAKRTEVEPAILETKSLEKIM